MLALASALPFLPTLGHGFVWDDHEQVVNNPLLHTWSSLGSFFQRDVLALSRADDQHSNYYRPLFFSLCLLLYQLFAANPVGWHAAAIAVHVAVVLASFGFARRLGLGPGTAFAAALLFAVHPVHGESVAWVAAAFNDPPAALAVLGALAAHLAWRRGGGRHWLTAAIAAFAVALGFKESALALLLLLPLVELWSFPAPSWREKARASLPAWLPYAALAAGYLALRKAMLGSFLGVYASAPPWPAVLPSLPRLAVAYLGFLVWPWGYAPSYPLRYVAGWAAPAAWGSLLVLLALALLLGLAWKRAGAAGRWLAFAAAWAAFAVLPALNVRSFRPTYLVHQRYLYLAVLGPCLALAWWLCEGSGRRFGKAGVAGLALLFAASTVYHDRFWASDEALWQRVAAVDPANPAAFDWLGARALARGEVAAARGLFERAIAADPDSPLGYRNLGVVLLTRLHDPAGALPLYEKALARFTSRPDLAQDAAEARINYGTALFQVGRGDEALAAFLGAAGEPPYPAAAARNAAVLLAGRGDYAGAARVLTAARERHPEDAVLAQMQRELPAREAAGKAPP